MAGLPIEIIEEFLQTARAWFMTLPVHRPALQRLSLYDYIYFMPSGTGCNAGRHALSPDAAPAKTALCDKPS